MSAEPQQWESALSGLNDRLARIETKLDRILNGPPKSVLTVRECMPLTGCRSLSAQHRWFHEHAVAPYARGKYRRLDVTNAVARAGLPVLPQRTNPVPNQ